MYFLSIEQCSNCARRMEHLFQADTLVSLPQAMESKWYESKLNFVKVNCRPFFVYLQLFVLID
jgi:hypothetical protein